MFAFAESLKRQEIKLITPNAKISQLSIHMAPILIHLDEVAKNGLKI